MNSTVYEGRKFETLRRFDEPGMFGGIALRSCEFHSCKLCQWVDPTYPLRVVDVNATGCQFHGNSIVGVQFENVAIDGCVTGTDPLTLRGCLFRRVLLRGKVGSWIVDDMRRELPDAEYLAFSEAARKFYASGDWALDITEADFESAALFSLPGDLVRRDPETQFLVRKDRLAGADLSTLSKAMRLRLKRVERNVFDSTVLVVGRDSDRFADDLAELRRLVDLGIAEAWHEKVSARRPGRRMKCGAPTEAACAA